MTPASVREQCFADFLKGASLRSIAEKYDLNRRTLERWSRNEHWVIRRQRAWTDTKEEIARKHISGEVRTDVLASEAAFDLFTRAYAERRAFYEGKLPKKALKFSGKDFVQLAKAFYFANIADRLGALGLEIADETNIGTLESSEFSKKPHEF